MKKIIVLVISVFLSLCIISYSPAEEKIVKGKVCVCPPSIGKAPNFNLKDLNGENVELSDFEGKGVILFFWATWCARCRGHMPELNEAYKRLKEEGIELVSIAVGDTAKKVKRYMRKNKIDFPVLTDTKEGVSQSYVVVGVPTFIVIDQAGYIQFQNHFWPRDYQKYLCKIK